VRIIKPYPKKEAFMESVSINKKYYCGIDLHADVMYACVMTKSGNVVFHHEMPTDISCLLKHLKPYLSSIAVCAESTFNCHCRSLSVRYPVLRTDLLYRFGTGSLTDAQSTIYHFSSVMRSI
jgi:hypothetical protein